MSCPRCGADEASTKTPRTFYMCGSSDYDQRPGTFIGNCTQGEEVTSTATPPAAVPTEGERAEAIRLWSLSFDSGAERASFVKDADSWDNEWLPIAESLATARTSARSAALNDVLAAIAEDPDRSREGCAALVRLAGRVQSMKRGT